MCGGNFPWPVSDMGYFTGTVPVEVIPPDEKKDGKKKEAEKPKPQK